MEIRLFRGLAHSSLQHCFNSATTEGFLAWIAQLLSCQIFSFNKWNHLKTVVWVYSGCLYQKSGRAKCFSQHCNLSDIFYVIFVYSITATSKAGIIAGAVIGALLLLLLLLFLVWLLVCCYQKQRYEKETANEIKWGMFFSTWHSVYCFLVYYYLFSYKCQLFQVLAILKFPQKLELVWFYCFFVPKVPHNCSSNSSVLMGTLKVTCL